MHRLPLAAIDMKKTVYIIALLVFAVSVSAQDGFREEIPYDLLVIDTPVVFEHYEDLKVYSYLATDSAKRKLDCSCKLNSQENTLTCTYNSHLNYVDGKAIEEYDAKGHLIARTFYESQNNFSKTLYSYNLEGKIQKIESFGYGRVQQLKPGISLELAYASYPKAQVMIEAYNDSLYNYSYAWRQGFLETYAYDSMGRPIQYGNVDLINQKQGSHTHYDSEGRISKKFLTRNYLPSSGLNLKEEITDSVSVTSEYSYFDNWYRVYSNSWDGVYVDTVYTDKEGRTTEHITHRQLFEGPLAGRDIPFQEFERFKYEYDALGRLTKQMMIAKVHHDRSLDFVKVTEYHYKNEDVPDIEQKRF